MKKEITKEEATTLRIRKKDWMILKLIAAKRAIKMIDLFSEITKKIK